MVYWRRAGPGYVATTAVPDRQAGMGVTAPRLSLAPPRVTLLNHSPSRPNPRSPVNHTSRFQQGDHMHNFLSVADLSRDDLSKVLERAAVLKEETRQGRWRTELKGKTVALLFQKPSLRTRVSFEQGVRQLGGYAIYLSPDEVGLGRRESVPDVARVLSRFVDCIVARTNSHSDLEELALHATVPVVNALSDLSHPCQCLADLLTVREKKDRLAGLTMAYIGDGNNVLHSLILGAAKVGLHLRVACPRGYEPSSEVVNAAAADCRATGSTISLLESPQEAAKAADILYTDVWTSMGLFDQAENRLHAQKGLLSWLFAG